MRDRLGPWLVLLAALAYDVMPLDIVPDAIPMMGWADDLGVTGLALLTAWTWWRKRREARAQLEADDGSAA